MAPKNNKGMSSMHMFFLLRRPAKQHINEAMMCAVEFFFGGGRDSEPVTKGALPMPKKERWKEGKMESALRDFCLY